MTGSSSVSFWQEQLHRSRQERMKLSQRWLDDLEVFVRDDAATVSVYREKREDVSELSEVVEALADDALGDA